MMDTSDSPSLLFLLHFHSTSQALLCMRRRQTQRLLANVRPSLPPRVPWCWCSLFLSLQVGGPLRERYHLLSLASPPLPRFSPSLPALSRSRLGREVSLEGAVPALRPQSRSLRGSVVDLPGTERAASRVGTPSC